jgi:tetratricopeptide (TPR) repeat protein
MEVALNCIEKAIEKADDNYAKYYYLRGCIHSLSGNFTNALSDLTISTNLDKNFQPAYLERGKVYFVTGDLKQAFLDIQKYISGKPEDSNIHLWAGNLLFNTGALEDAVRAYSNSETVTRSERLLALRAKCNIVLKELNAALSDLNRLVDLKSVNSIAYLIDRDCLLSLKTASTIAKDQEDLDPANLVSGTQEISKLLSYKSSGSVFKIYELYFYKAVFHFYLQEYQQALDDMDSAWYYKEKAAKREAKKKKTETELREMIKVLEEFGSDREDDEEEDEITRRSTFDSREYVYNKAIICLMVRIKDLLIFSFINTTRP